MSTWMDFSKPLNFQRCTERYDFMMALLKHQRSTIKQIKVLKLFSPKMSQYNQRMFAIGLKVPKLAESVMRLTKSAHENVDPCLLACLREHTQVVKNERLTGFTPLR